MEEKFEYGELVMVRDFDDEEWQARLYVGTMPNCKLHWTAQGDEYRIDDFKGFPNPWRQIRKFVPEPEPEPLFISTQGVFTAEEAVMQLQERIEKLEAIFNGAIKHINEQNKSIKTQIK
jgi:hypothetical protein